jgi:hypothetical protein
VLHVINNGREISMSLSREDRINELRVIDNVGMLDGVDLENLTEDEFDRLENDVISYSKKRLKAWCASVKK